MQTNKIRHRKKSAFLAAFCECGNVSKSTKAAKINRTTHYQWLKDDPEYAAAFSEAEQIAVAELEDEARKRAMKGSDLLMIFLLKHLKPERYRERLETKVSGTVEHSVNVRHLVEELQDNEDFISFARNRAAGGDASLLCGHGQSRPVADGPASDSHRSSGNGHDSGPNGKDSGD